MMLTIAKSCKHELYVEWCSVLENGIFTTYQSLNYCIENPGVPMFFIRKCKMCDYEQSGLLKWEVALG